MAKVLDKSALGRQSRLPFRRAFSISMNSLKIRFWRSIVTAGGIFLGIAFLSVVLTQSLMQWPVPEKVDAGMVRISGQVNAPRDYDVWKPVPVQAGIEAGIPADVVKLVAEGDKFRLALIVQGDIQAKRADKNLARLSEEWKSLVNVQKPLTFCIDAAANKDMKVSDAIKCGVPSALATKLAGKAKTFKGSDLVDAVREQPDLLPSLYSAAILDQDISVNDAVKAGVPEAIATHLAGEGKTFKASALNDAITAQPTWIAIWKGRVERNAIFKTVDKAAIARLDRQYAISLNELIGQAKNPSKEADKTNVMVINTGRKLKANFEGKDGLKAGEIKLVDGDNILVPDRNSRYRMIWLVVMSLLVCTVGITNSMLMAVTERFKEIGTMKCLGALDKFVVELFMLESGMMGIVASVLGWAAGFIMIILIAGFTRGWGIVGNIEFLDVLKIFGETVTAGLVLTIVATIAPAMRAASMPAAMALRSEI